MDLRSEVPERSAWVDSVQEDWRSAELQPRERAIAEFAAKQARHPEESSAADLDDLRAAGLDDRAILDLVHVIGFFSYANRMADALGCDLETGMPPPHKYRKR